MTDTPITDAAAEDHRGCANSECVHAEVARELERKLALAREALLRSLPTVEAESERFDSCCPDEVLANHRAALAATDPAP